MVDSATYTFEVAAVDDDGLADPTPARQQFDFYNNAPVVFFVPGTLPEKSLPAITFYLGAVDPDTTLVEDDNDSRANLSHYRVWLDGGSEEKIVPIDDNEVTMRVADFEGAIWACGPYFSRPSTMEGSVAPLSSISGPWNRRRPTASCLWTIVV